MWDFRSMLVYNSTKVVKVKDWKLALSYYAMLIAILIYVVNNMIKTGINVLTRFVFG
jgi:hypothetical protein